ncbi:MAG: SWIM zinc finger family protein [Terriglobia bacterium]
MGYGWGGWRPYVSVADRRRKAAREMDKLRKKGHPVSPVIVEGRTIVKTFWGKAWCENLERYSDYANRLPRGRTYVRNGSVLDLQIASGEIKALVSGSQIYHVVVKVTPVTKARWRSICTDCAGAIDSLVELLQGRFSKGVMERICRQKSGLFPSPDEIKLSCSCPDWASMCKHVAAVLYGIGARLDQKPELLFRLHDIDEKELIAKAGEGLALTKRRPDRAKVLGGEDLSELFGLDMAQSTAAGAGPADRVTARAKSANLRSKTKRTKLRVKTTKVDPMV